jgi:hypothetical protein
MSDSEVSSNSDFSADSEDENTENTDTILCVTCKREFSSEARGCDVESKLCPVCLKVEMAGVLQENSTGDSTKPDDYWNCDHEGCSKPFVSPCTECKGDYCGEHADSHSCSDYLAAEEAKKKADVDRKDDNESTLTNDDGKSSGEEGKGSGDASSTTVTVSAEKQTDHFLSRRISAILEAFLGDETSITIRMAGRDQTYVRKKFKGDKSGIVTLFIDAETLDHLPLLFDYFVLSGHVNSTKKRACFSLCVIKDSHGKKYVLLCILRAKQMSPRYDVVLLDVACTDPEKAVTRMYGLTSLFKFFIFLPDESFDHKYALDQLKEYVLRANLVWTKEGPNKDGSGRLMSEGYSPFSSIDVDGNATLEGRRIRQPGSTFADEQAAGKLKSSGRGRQGTRGSSAKKKKKAAGLRKTAPKTSPSLPPLSPSLPCSSGTEPSFGGYDDTEVRRIINLILEDEYFDERIIAFFISLAVILLIDKFFPEGTL